MRLRPCAAALLVIAAVALPVGAAIKAMTLAELMSVTDDAVVGTIVEKGTVRLDTPWAGALYTRIVVQGESLRTGATGEFALVFHGSHERSDEYIVSEMPTLKDSRVGGQVVAFFEKAKEGGPPMDLVHSWANLYRVEESFGQPVVMGKGEGSAFPLNLTLGDVRNRVSATHVQLAKTGKLSIPGMAK